MAPTVVGSRLLPLTSIDFHHVSLLPNHTRKPKGLGAKLFRRASKIDKEKEAEKVSTPVCFRMAHTRIRACARARTHTPTPIVPTGGAGEGGNFSGEVQAVERGEGRAQETRGRARPNSLRVVLQPGSVGGHTAAAT